MKKESILLLAMVSTFAVADEGMWQPQQLPSIANELTQAGLKLNPNDLTDLTGFPMGAIVSLGGCTASFVSDKGLVATNHHCIYGSIQYNSTAENNLLADGFLAKSFDEELPATPGSRIYVTEKIDDVTSLIKASITENMSGTLRYKTIVKNSKRLVAECESDDKYRCSVVNFHGGLEYYLFKQLTIRDVRLVHAPASSVGKYGGDIDNWMWPRHTGDYGFYRAYVGKDGLPADFNKDNVPYEPKHHLKVNKSG
ncbi:MAG: S46 family peptidase, partial [Alteromonadaceae bacterium]